jgi:hypothetical protein
MPFATLIGAELVSASPEEARGRLEWAPERPRPDACLVSSRLSAWHSRKADGPFKS